MDLLISPKGRYYLKMDCRHVLTHQVLRDFVTFRQSHSLMVTKLTEGKPDCFRGLIVRVDGQAPLDNLGPTGPTWAPCWPHELCCLGRFGSAFYTGPYFDVVDTRNGCEFSNTRTLDCCYTDYTSEHTFYQSTQSTEWYCARCKITKRVGSWEISYVLTRFPENSV